MTERRGSCLPDDEGEPAEPLEGELCLDGNFALPEEAFPGEEAAVLLVGLFPAVARLLVGLLPAVTLLLVGLLPALTLLLPVGPIDLREERFDPVKLEDDVGLPVYVVSSSMRKPRGAGDDDRTLHTRTHTHTHTRTHTHTHKHIYIYIYICKYARTGLPHKGAHPALTTPPAHITAVAHATTYPHSRSPCSSSSDGKRLMSVCVCVCV
eukprot:GHVU01223272.1.p4 GENE.GHVU01223272.1~~GHVU01223272.1.p4  ORF type:complete len:209 (+),score=24.67 GHVU01223272.1:140-766(+)